MNELLLCAAIALGTCLVVGAVGAVVLHLVRRKSLRHQLIIAALLPVVAVTATVLINVRLMFLSSHDSEVILVSLATAGVLAVGGSWLVMRQIVRASLQVGEELGQLVAESTGLPAGDITIARRPHAVPQELASVLDDLAEARTTLAELRTRERAAHEARRELVSFMSHDLRTPLAGLRALSEGLEDGVIADVPKALSHLRGTVTRMTGLVDDLFALSRVQGAVADKPKTPVSITEILSDVTSELVTTAEACEVSLSLEVPEQDRLSVEGSGDDLTRAVANLVTNAIRHTYPGMAVRLVGRRVPDGQVQIAVIDECGGISESDLPRLFDTGWRGTPSRSGDDGGAGLGLSIARGVVQSHHGDISVSNVTGGCQFLVSLPPSGTPTGSSPASHADQRQRYETAQ